LPDRLRRAVPAAVLAALSAAGPGCASAYRSSADREVAAILSAKEEVVRRQREERFVSPRAPAEGEDASAVTGDVRAAPVEVPEVVALQDALRIAVTANRDYASRRESLYLSALSLTAARRDFSPRMRAAISWATTDGTGRTRDQGGTASAGVGDVLPTGATVDLSASSTATDAKGPGTPSSTTGTLAGTLTQPLLRGGGYEASHEALTAAERSLVYDVREFARFREQFLVDVTRRFYAIVAQEEVVRNTRQRYDSVLFQMRRTKALYDVGRQEQIELLRAQNDGLRVQNDLVDAEQAYALAVDEFKVFLGLPMRTALRLAADPPPFVPSEIALASAVEAALANRFDLATARDRLEDVERAFRIAKRNLLPDLALTASFGRTSDPSREPADQTFREGSNSVGLALQIPLDRTSERNAFRSAQIALDRERREYERTRDGVVVEVRDTLRRLKQAEVSLRIQQEIIAVEEKRVRKARLDFEGGRVGNRDVLEAEQSLLSARNARIRALVDYEIARIDIERVMGTLEVGDDGTWRGRRAPGEAGKGGS